MPHGNVNTECEGSKSFNHDAIVCEYAHGGGMIMRVVANFREVSWKFPFLVPVSHLGSRHPSVVCA